MVSLRIVIIKILTQAELIEIERMGERKMNTTGLPCLAAKPDSDNQAIELIGSH